MNIKCPGEIDISDRPIRPGRNSPDSAPLLQYSQPNDRRADRSSFHSTLLLETLPNNCAPVKTELIKADSHMSLFQASVSTKIIPLLVLLLAR